MICAFPKTTTFGHTFPCGGCMPCRVNRLRAKKARILMESFTHEVSSWVTVTYRDEELPWLLCEGMPMPVLRISDFQLWIKRYRKAMARPGIRYFGVGEYGDKYGRPHFHAVLFGEDPYQVESVLDDTWGMGRTHVREADHGAMQYVAGYTVKKLTRGNDRLGGRPPEQSFCSRNPPIGWGYLRDNVVPALFTRRGCAAIAEGRLSGEIRLAGKKYPLDRTMRLLLTEELGLPADYPWFVMREATDGEIEKARNWHEKARRENRRRCANADL